MVKRINVKRKHVNEKSMTHLRTLFFVQMETFASFRRLSSSASLQYFIQTEQQKCMCVHCSDAFHACVLCIPFLTQTQIIMIITHFVYFNCRFRAATQTWPSVNDFHKMKQQRTHKWHNKKYGMIKNATRVQNNCMRTRRSIGRGGCVLQWRRRRRGRRRTTMMVVAAATEAKAKAGASHGRKDNNSRAHESILAFERRRHNYRYTCVRRNPFYELKHTASMCFCLSRAYIRICITHRYKYDTLNKAIKWLLLLFYMFLSVVVKSVCALYVFLLQFVFDRFWCKCTIDKVAAVQRTQ